MIDNALTVSGRPHPVRASSRSRSTAWFADAERHELLRAGGLDNLDSLFARGASARMRHKGRSVWSAELTAGLREPLRLFIKMHWGRRRLWPRMTDLKTGQAYQSLARREWDGLNRLEAAGLHVPRRWALFEEGRLHVRSAVIVQAVPPPRSLEELIELGKWEQLSTTRRGTLLDLVVATVRRIHTAGLGWRGASSKHFYPEWLPSEGWRMWLIDCEGVHKHITRKGIARDYRTLIRSLQRCQADSETLDRLRQRIERTQAYV